MRFLRVTYLWILLTPIALIFTGAMSNQVVLIANHDTFPVMVNPIHITDMGGVSGSFGDTNMLDGVHCVMTPQTHLNWMADIFDLGGAIYSIGDGFLELGYWTLTWMPFVWGFAVIRRLVRVDVEAVNR